YLFDPNGQLVASVNGTTVVSTSTAQIVYTVPPYGGGTYTVEVTSFSPGKTGNYSLSATCQAAPTSPILNVTSAGNPVNNGGTVDFGSTALGLPVVKTFTLANDPAATTSLTISGVTSTGPFTLLSQPTTSPLAQGNSTTFQVQFDGSPLGSQTGTLR